MSTCPTFAYLWHHSRELGLTKISCEPATKVDLRIVEGPLAWPMWPPSRACHSHTLSPQLTTSRPLCSLGYSRVPYSQLSYQHSHPPSRSSSNTPSSKAFLSWSPAFSTGLLRVLEQYPIALKFSSQACCPT